MNEPFFNSDKRYLENIKQQEELPDNPYQGMSGKEYFLSKWGNKIEEDWKTRQEKDQNAILSAAFSNTPANNKLAEIYWSKDKEMYKKDPESYKKQHNVGKSLDQALSVMAGGVKSGMQTEQERVVAQRQLADKMYNAGQSLMGGGPGKNPKKGMELINNSFKIRSDVLKQEEDQLKVHSSRISSQNDIFNTIKSQSDLNNAWAELADTGFEKPKSQVDPKTGKEIPSPYTDFSNPITQNWIKQKAVQSKSYKDQIELDIKLKNEQRLEQAQKDKQAKDRFDEQHKNQVLALQKERIQSKTTKDITMTELPIVTEELKVIEGFSDLPVSHQMPAATDYLARTTAYERSGIDSVRARQYATADIAKAIDGKVYDRNKVPNMPSSIKEVKSTNSKPVFDNAEKDQAAKWIKDNPTASKTQIDKIKEHYGLN
jgi:hypothetical protein